MTNNNVKFNKNTIKNIVIAALAVLLLLVIVISTVSMKANADSIPAPTPVQNGDAYNVTIIIPVDTPVDTDDTVEDVTENKDIIEDIIIEDTTVEDDVVDNEIFEGYDQIFEAIPPVVTPEESVETESSDEEDKVLFDINFDVCYNITFEIDGYKKFIVKLDNYCTEAVMYFMHYITTYEGPIEFAKTENGLVLDLMGEDMVFTNENIIYKGETFGYVRSGFKNLESMINAEEETFNVVSTLVVEH